jgi:hypothetical protein
VTVAWLALLLALGAPATAQAEPGRPPGALAGLAEAVAAALGAPEEGRRGLALALQAPSDGLAPSLTAALLATLGRSGWSVSAVGSGAGAEAAARAVGADWLLRLTAGGAADGRELVAVGEAIPLWASFFLQARPGVRPAPPRLVSVRTPSDEAARLLLRQERHPDLAKAVLRRLARLPYLVLALAAGDAGEPGPSILVVEPRGVRLLDATGRALAARTLDPSGRRPVRLPAATAVLAPLGGGRIGVALAGAPAGEVLVRHGGRLDLVATLPMVPLASGEAGLLFGAFAEDKGALQDLLSNGADPSARPRSALDLTAVTAAPHGGRVAFAALLPAGLLQLLGPDLAPVGAVAGVGAGFALADLDGDGAAELVASQATAGGADRLRVVRPALATPPAGARVPDDAAAAAGRAPGPVIAFQSGPIEGQFTAAAAADLTGDGLDDAILAAEVAGQDGTQATELWLLTLDPLEAR